ncbi:MAG TPA: hypothetical protein VM285_07315 [Polyangia bacterium]|nr:hypothetical protein [Polyangia bacterium]
MKDTQDDILVSTDENTQLPRIVEEEVDAAGDRPNTCRACGGSQFC